jgi:autotransporter-associated beta strand protein
LTKVGSGTEVITGANTYTGPTVINAGTLQIGTGGTNGSIASTSGISGSAGATLVYDLSTSGTLSNITGSGFNVTQTGSGTLYVPTTLGYTGTTSVTNGTVIVTGGLSGSAVVTGGTLGGGGSISGSVTIGSGGTLYTSAQGAGTPAANQMGIGGNLSFANGSTYEFDINSGSPGTPGSSDELLITGSLTLAGTVTLSGSDIGNAVLSPSSGDTYVIADASQGINGTFANSLLQINQNWFSVGYQSDNFGGEEVVLTASVPEPSTWASILAGAAMLIGIQRRRRHVRTK